jgi:flagellar motility protein MotE (MotC chaperone)
MKRFGMFTRRPLTTLILGTGLLFIMTLAEKWSAKGGESRLGTLLAGSAMAEGDIFKADLEEPVDSPQAKKATEAPRSVFQVDPLQSLSEALKAKQLELDRRERALDERVQRLDSLRKEIEQNLVTVDQRLAQMAKIAGQADQNRQKELRKWGKIYEAMLPQQAGEVIGDLDPEFALELLEQMNPKKAGKILSNVDQKRAVELGRALHHKQP